MFLISAGFFVITMATYVEGNSLHPERGGASTFARYAFDEFWSFIAGWAILLDYLIVMALAAVAISDYLAAFWGELGNGYVETLIAALAMVFVAVANIRGLGAERLRTVLRLSLVGIALLVVASALVFAELFDLGVVFDTVDLGSRPTWEDAIFATVDRHRGDDRDRGRVGAGGRGARGPPRAQALRARRARAPRWCCSWGSRRPR